MRTGFIGNSAQLDKTRSCSMHWAGESTAGWPSQAVQTWAGVLNINVLVAFTSVFCSRRIFYSSTPLPPPQSAGKFIPEKKWDQRMCVSWGFLTTDKTCGKSHRWAFSFITQQDLALVFLRNLLLSVSLFMQFDCYDMYSSWNLKSIELGPTSSKWPLIGNSVTFEISDANGSPLPFQRSRAFTSAPKWSMPSS